MNNLGSMYRFEVRKIVCRKITAIAMIAVVLLMVAMSIGEHVSGAKIVNKEELVLVGRAIDDKMLDEMRAAVEPKTITMDDGTQIAVGIGVNDPAYQPLMDYLITIGGNIDKAYNMTEADLEKRFSGVIDEIIQDQHLTASEVDYWQSKRAQSQMPLLYGKIQNGWGDSVCIMYFVAILSMISIATTLSGVFSDEAQLHTDALIFSSRNGKKRLAAAKLLAGITVGIFETLVVLLACVGTEFVISGFDGGDASVQFFVGPTAMDMRISTAFWIYHENKHRVLDIRRNYARNWTADERHSHVPFTSLQQLDRRDCLHDGIMAYQHAESSVQLETDFAGVQLSARHISRQLDILGLPHGASFRPSVHYS